VRFKHTSDCMICICIWSSIQRIHSIPGYRGHR
jgi:hypothetical protein